MQLRRSDAPFGRTPLPWFVAERLKKGRTSYRQRAIKNGKLKTSPAFYARVIIARRARSLKILGNLSACRMPCGASTYESLDVSEWMLFEETATGCMCSEFALQQKTTKDDQGYAHDAAYKMKEIKIAYHDDLDHYPAKEYAKGRHTVPRCFDKSRAS